MPDRQEAPEVLDRLVQRAASAGASDIHLQRNGAGAALAFRLDGVIGPAGALEDSVAERVFGRIKYLARLKTYQESFPQEGRIDRDRSPIGADIRVSTYPTVTGEKIVLRLFQDAAGLGLDDLGFPAEAVGALKRFLESGSGILLLTGPAGSGKTTTIYACLEYLVGAHGRHIITVEDPVERVIPGVMQTEVNDAIDLTFAEAARRLLRQDPEVLVIGEVRDEETADIALRAALTGHMVLSTLHAGSCQGVFERLFLMHADRYAVVNTVELVINQRLLRKTCASCSGTGCDACLTTGYRGRLPVVEWVRLNESSRARVRSGKTETLRPDVPLREAARMLVAAGRTTGEEIARVLGS